MKVLDRFEDKYIPEPNTGCWLWVGNTPNNLYGQFWNGEKRVLAHRWSYEYHVGPIPDGMLVCHRCDTPSCVNPNHLFLGTHLDNNRDRDKKNRNSQARKTHCLNGHEFSSGNTRHYKGQRWCRRCDADRRLRYRKRVS